MLNYLKRPSINRQLDLFGKNLFATKKRKASRGKRLGRPARPDRAGFVAHVARPQHDARHPVHVSMKRAAGLPDLRAQRVLQLVLREIERAQFHGLPVIHASVQRDHVHLIVEADDKLALSRGVQKLFSRIAMALNALCRRSGRVFRDRHHRRPLKTPTEVRNALVYVMFNTRRHDASGSTSLAHWLTELDPCSSAMWFEDWHPRSRPPEDQIAKARARAGPCPLAAPSTWLARDGWKRAGGPIRFSEYPRMGT